MDNASASNSLLRIESALTRIERAVSRIPDASQIAAENERLRKAVSGSVRELDRLLEEVAG